MVYFQKMNTVVLWNNSFQLLFTRQGLVGVVKGVLVDEGGVAVVGDVSGSNTHCLEKEMSSRATSPLGPSPCSYLKTI